MTFAKGLKLVNRDAGGVDLAFRADVLAGLAADQKAIPARWFYDDAGSQLFEDITQLPEYYPTRAETAILRGRSQEIAELIGPGRAVVEFGSGSSVKTPLLLSAIEPSAYVPLDIAGDFLRASSAALAAKFPGLPVYPVEADFMRRVELPGEVEGLGRNRGQVWSYRYENPFCRWFQVEIGEDQTVRSAGYGEPPECSKRDEATHP